MDERGREKEARGKGEGTGWKGKRGEIRVEMEFNGLNGERRRGKRERSDGGVRDG